MCHREGRRPRALDKNGKTRVMHSAVLIHLHISLVRSKFTKNVYQDGGLPNPPAARRSSSAVLLG
jgi:hypothetical protein